MRFDCPQCTTPHEYPDEEIPAQGVVVGCTECGSHITLSLEMDFDDGKTGVEPVDMELSDPRARSVRIRLDDMDWSEHDESRVVPPLAERASGDRPIPEAPVDHSGPGTGTMIRRALSSLSQGLSLSDVPPPPESSGSTTGDVSDSSHQGHLQEWRYSDVLLALKAPMDLQRLAWATVGCWLVLAVFANLTALTVWVMEKSDFAGNLLMVTTQAFLCLGLLVVGAFCAHHSTSELIHGQRAPLGDSIDWVRRWLRSILGVPLCCSGLVALALVLESMTGALGRIPGAGPVLWGLLSPITFATSLMAGLTVVALIYALPLYIPLIVNERTGPKNTLKRMLKIYRTEGLGLVGMVTASVVGAISMALLVFGPLLYVSMQITTHVGRVTMGKNLTGVFLGTPDAFLHGWMGFVQPFALPKEPRMIEMTHEIGGTIAGLSGLIAPALVIATILVMVFSAGVILFGRVSGEARATN